MTSLFRTIVIVLVLAAPLALWTIGVRFAWIPNVFQENSRCDDNVERLELALKRREEARRQAVQKLLFQSCNLSQTLQRFQELNQEWPDLSVMARVAGAKESDRDIAYRLILDYVRMALWKQSEELTVVLRRLKEDYQQLQRSDQIPIR